MRGKSMGLVVSIEKILKEFTLKAQLKADAECLGLMGPSGSGKSMTLKCIAGIETPDKGKIILDGKVLFDSDKNINLTPQERKIGYLFQGYALFPNMTVEENIHTGLKARKMSKQEIENRTMEMLKRFHIEELQNRYPRQLSGGQKQRAALARLMAYEPEVILLDEPFSALDEDLREELQHEIRNMLADFHRPSILVSHNSKEINNLCNKKYQIIRGQIQ
ncbi:MAG: ATP-binding cassette domain-containing protein [Anaerostipes faecalis]|uniref:sulfate/molybdate ABC transporter ATP-binding protein n=2 Tax=Lachnospiraceae TaxID=186803 RepID=UPI001E5832BB|nr:ATP-binding cassette domain-containing protein [Anaerostipes faecalis]MDY2725413.1 ATP-binding cassette domain-containing protein [Anaerostipes faecalis]